MSISAAEIARAADLLHDVVAPTPLEYSRWLSELVGGDVFLKCENLQRTGSFKLRGAYVRMARLTKKERARGVVAASAGNHAQGVALAAQLLGIKATVFMPHGAPIPKEKATRAYGAQIRFVGTSIDECLASAREFEAETGAILIHPFDHPDIVAGQATTGLEIVEQCPQVRTVVVPTGGGGLVAGIASAMQRDGMPISVVGVQAAGAAAYPASLAAGAPVALATMSTMADGIAVGLPGQVPFAAIQAHVGEILTVGEDSLSKALLLVLERAKLVVEPAGAAAVAAVLDDPLRFKPPVVVVLSGGNIDPVLLMRVLRHGMAAAGRYLSLRVRIPDTPGGLASLLTRLAEVEANIIEVLHERISETLNLDEVEVALQLETRGEEHRMRVLTSLTSHGYTYTLN
ncbi:threonine dehydratase [Kribbella flavida DSM 17836]|uniref:L-threonine dehydratase catabolic TdcB n=1 Tax=Kribbella flavida (strain DSM 17836 / JCM 10339 / NBRC 14399) TaxID=479435 RepID=D2PP37_KRIFD|nr:threonine ammonia-lyase [Kribbella flavida]ADB34633.1 threonine dehydratase [Kribbella flavida DSM 17836]